MVTKYIILKKGLGKEAYFDIRKEDDHNSNCLLESSHVASDGCHGADECTKFLGYCLHAIERLRPP